MFGAGRLRERIGVQQADDVTGGHGGQAKSWAEVFSMRAERRDGPGSERREAAQQSAVQSATFVVRDTSRARRVSTTDRLTTDDGIWNITSNVPARERGMREITATREMK